MARTGGSTTGPEVALIVGGGPGISASCARLFVQDWLKVAVAARNIEKPVLKDLSETHQVDCYKSDAADPTSVADLFAAVSER